MRKESNKRLKEVIDGGGDGSISEVRFVEGLTDEQVISLFQNSRKSDYEKIVQDANHLLAEWSSGNMNPRDPAVKATAQVAKLQRQFENIITIDFFKEPERGTAEILIRDLAARASGDRTDAVDATDGFDGLRDNIWVPWKTVFVDRIACGWLIRRFVDEAAIFKYVDSDTYAPDPEEIRFDMFEGEYTHEGDRCSFEVMIKRLSLQDWGLAALSEVIHDIDLKDSKYDRAETDGFNALLTGLAASEPDDDKRMTQGLQLFDNLYAYFQRQRGIRGV